MNIFLTIVWSGVILLDLASAHAAPSSAVSGCEDSYSSLLPPEGVSELLERIETAQGVIRSVHGRVDPEVEANYLEYLREYKKLVIESGESGGQASALPAGSSRRARQERARERLDGQIQRMRHAAEVLRNVPYPADDIQSMKKGLREMDARFGAMEDTWFRVLRTQKEIDRLTALRQQYRNDGKFVASSTARIDALKNDLQLAEIRLRSTITGLSASELEKGFLLDLVNQPDYREAIAKARKRAAGDFSGKFLDTLQDQVRDREDVVSQVLAFTKKNSTERLEREIDANQKTYALATHDYYADLFPWNRHSEKFRRHSELLNPELRGKLLEAEKAVEKARTEIAADRAEVRRLWEERRRLLGVLNPGEEQLGRTERDWTSQAWRVQAIQRVGTLYGELQAIEQRLLAYFPPLDPGERVELLSGDSLTQAKAQELLARRLSVLEAQARSYREEKDDWIRRFQGGAGDAADDDIELF